MSGLRLTQEQLNDFVAELEKLCVKHMVTICPDCSGRSSNIIRVDPVSKNAFAGADFEFEALDTDAVKGSQAE
jgi:hypothetical protein